MLLFFGSFVDTMKEALDIKNRNELVGYLLCLPLGEREPGLFFTTAGDRPGENCFGRRCVILDYTKESRLCNSGPDNQKVDQEIRDLFQSGERDEIISQNFTHLMNRYELPFWDNLTFALQDLIKDADRMHKDTKEELLSLSSGKERIERVDFYINVLKYALEVSAKPPTNREVFKSYFPSLPPTFTGRTQLIDRLKKSFSDNHIQILTGPGGIGKTSVAIAFAKANQRAYKSIWWIDASSEDSLLSSVSTFLRVNFVSVKNADSDTLRVAFTDFLDSRNKWLLIFDNCDSYTEEEFSRIQAFFPRSLGPGRDILITSRANNSFTAAKLVPVKRFLREESVSYLTVTAELDDPEGATTLAERLGDHPLAERFASIYIKETPGATFADVLDLLKHSGTDFFSDPSEADKNTVRNTLLLSFNRMLSDAEKNGHTYKAELERVVYLLSVINRPGIDLSIFEDPSWSTSAYAPENTVEKEARKIADLPYDLIFDSKAEIRAFKKSLELDYLPKEIGRVRSRRAAVNAKYSGKVFNFFDKKDRAALIRLLKRYSVTDVDRQQNLSLHPLVSEILREELKARGHYDETVREALRLNYKYFLRLYPDYIGTNLPDLDKLRTTLSILGWLFTQPATLHTSVYDLSSEEAREIRWCLKTSEKILSQKPFKPVYEKLIPTIDTFLDHFSENPGEEFDVTTLSWPVAYALLMVLQFSSIHFEACAEPERHAKLRASAATYLDKFLYKHARLSPGPYFFSEKKQGIIIFLK